MPSDRDERMCVCGHIAHWHAAVVVDERTGLHVDVGQGNGWCEHDGDCRCQRFSAAATARYDCREVVAELVAALDAFCRMPDAGLTADDPRFEWWYETAEVRKRAREAAKRFERTLSAAATARPDWERAVTNACYALDPNQGEHPDAGLAYRWLRTTYPKDHPNYVDPTSLGPSFYERASLGEGSGEESQ